MQTNLSSSAPLNEFDLFRKERTATQPLTSSSLLLFFFCFFFKTIYTTDYTFLSSRFEKFPKRHGRESPSLPPIFLSTRVLPPQNSGLEFWRMLFQVRPIPRPCTKSLSLRLLPSFHKEINKFHNIFIYKSFFFSLSLHFSICLLCKDAMKNEGESFSTTIQQKKKTLYKALTR